MSRWLKSVNSLLERLDDRVENVVEERTLMAMEEQLLGSGTNDDEVNALDDILARRGLAVPDDTHDDEEEYGEEEPGQTAAEDSATLEHPEGETVDEIPEQSLPEKESSLEDMNVNVNVNVSTDLEAQKVDNHDPDRFDSESEEKHSNENEGNVEADTSSINAAVVSTSEVEADFSEKNEEAIAASNGSNETNVISEVGMSVKTANDNNKNINNKAKESSSFLSIAAPVSFGKKSGPPTPTRPSNNSNNRSERERELTAEVKEAQKEARTLRRHVVSLNAQLETAEAEIQAQRKELELAAERMEKDRARAKEQKAALEKRVKEDLASQKAQHEQSLKDQQVRFEEQLATYREKIVEVENRLLQEGGDWTKEMTQAVEREQSMRDQVIRLEDERNILLSQISTLQGQQATLGSRLESLTQAADNAMARERDAEDRLDAALSQHARQISQRQAREAELEHVIQELNAALVTAGSKRGSFSNGESGDLDNDKPQNEGALKARLESLQQDLQNAHAQLMLEKERSEALHQQLRAMSKETTQEASSVQMKQFQYERQIAEMSVTISKLQASLRDPVAVNSSSEANKADDEDTTNQVKYLSEEVLRLRDKLANQSSESKTMRSRLQAALDRAKTAEDELLAATATNGNDAYDIMERASGGLGRRRKPGAPISGSIRSVMRLNAGQGERSEQIGQVVDAVDSFAVSTGKYLRRNPWARAGFILYLLLIHLWSFVLLFYHAHSFETGRGDESFGMPHGPGSMMEQHKQQLIKPVSLIKPDGETSP